MSHESWVMSQFLLILESKHIVPRKKKKRTQLQKDYMKKEKKETIAKRLHEKRKKRKQLQRDYTKTAQCESILFFQLIGRSENLSLCRKKKSEFSKDQLAAKFSVYNRNSGMQTYKHISRALEY